jgi:TatD DNase family protein
MQLFDSHCHIHDERIRARITEIMSRAKDAGVMRILCCGTKENDWDAVAELSQGYQGVVPAFGLHPWFIRERSGQWLERLASFLVRHPHAALGEIGLDHAIEYGNGKDQAEIFIAQLKLARELRRPVSIHCRKAWGALIPLLQQQCGLPNGGVVHSYSGPIDLILTLSGLNVSFSFSGSITYDRNKRGARAATLVPDERLLVETDSPDIPPVGIGQGSNEPANLTMVVQQVAELRNTTVQAVADLTFENAQRLFTLSA